MPLNVQSSRNICDLYLAPLVYLLISWLNIYSVTSYKLWKMFAILRVIRCRNNDVWQRIATYCTTAIHVNILCFGTLITHQLWLAHCTRSVLAPIFIYLYSLRPYGVSGLGHNRFIVSFGPLGRNLRIKLRYIYWIKCVSKCRLQNVSHFVQASICWWVDIHLLI